MGVVRDYLREYWNEQKKKEAKLDKLLSPRFDNERLPGEGFSAFKKRWKKNPF